MTASPSLDTSDLDYRLPPELVAQHPAPQRGASRLMVVEAGRAEPRTIGRFDELLLDQLRADDLVVANDARVLHARVPLRRATGGAGEVLLLAPTEHQPAGAGTSRWTAMARPARKFRPGDEVATTRDPAVGITFVERVDPQVWTVDVPSGLDAVPGWLRAHGELPLPPYVTERGQDEARYQTVHARADGSVAAPTAGLHFDEATWQRVRDRCEVAHVTLHVGAGTFLPVAEGPLAAHPMHAERYEVPPSTDLAVRAARAAGRRVVAIGTTTTRTLEHVYGPDGTGALTGSTQLFIVPGHRWACVGAMLTNFHLPKSTLVALVMAFGGEAATRAWYEHAIEERMRFFSFGDAMFLH
ncbi:MAG: tRNA preQ1(34) S-adenosylmethionine ribosyltransferase-isomerase QueA, partial [Thermoleophilia bacterium]|nr:tRNA preQ1(34) S-adenosylmethionine ribosyltransferase-isomerase QueA [Thermoleophilia bacterium]